MRAFYFLILLCSALPGSAKAQVFRDNAVFNERHFLFEVKQIDEFIERFNDDRNSFLRTNIKRYYPRTIINRPILIRALFDSKNNRISDSDRESFIAAVNDSHHPWFLSFNQGDWYAEAICHLRYRNKDIDVSALLKVVTTQGTACKWMIYAVHSKLIAPYSGSVSLPVCKDPTRFLSPMCHATNFICLGGIFDNIACIDDYLDKSFMKDPESLSFLHALLNKEIAFQYVSSVRYHFLQVKKWSFMVENFDRKDSYNAGWLISGLEKCADNDKKTINTLF